MVIEEKLCKFLIDTQNVLQGTKESNTKIIGNKVI